jgi:methanogenic corrinoid protein MtbC1
MAQVSYHSLRSLAEFAAEILSINELENAISNGNSSAIELQRHVIERGTDAIEQLIEMTPGESELQKLKVKLDQNKALRSLLETQYFRERIEL